MINLSEWLKKERSLPLSLIKDQATRSLRSYWSHYLVIHILLIELLILYFDAHNDISIPAIFVFFVLGAVPLLPMFISQERPRRRVLLWIILTIGEFSILTYLTLRAASRLELGFLIIAMQIIGLTVVNILLFPLLLSLEKANNQRAVKIFFVCATLALALVIVLKAGLGFGCMHYWHLFTELGLCYSWAQPIF